MFLLVDDVNVLRAAFFIKSLVNYAFVLVPVVVILLSMFTIAKCVMSGNQDEFKSAIRVCLTRLIIGAVIFFIPTIVNIAVSLIDNYSESTFTKLYFLTESSLKLEIENQKKECAVKGNNWMWDENANTCVENHIHEDNSSQLEANAIVHLNTAPSAGSIGSTSGEDTGSGSTNGGDVKYFNQGDYRSVKFCSNGKTVKSSGCGAVSLAMVTYHFSGTSHGPKAVAKWLCSNGHSGGGMSYKQFTKKKMLNHYKLKVDTLFSNGAWQGNSGKSYKSSQANKILKAVKEGKMVILYIPGHYVAIGPNSKCKENQVYLYDPGCRTCIGCYTMPKLWKQTYNNRNRCKENRNCGWKAAWAYTKA